MLQNERGWEVKLLLPLALLHQFSPYIYVSEPCAMLHPMRENPIRVLRSGLTQKELAKQLGITPQIVVSAEAGLFNGVPSSFYALLGPDRSPTDQAALDADYTRWVWERRKANAHHFPTPLPYEEFGQWKKRTATSHRGFCKLLVFNPQLLTRFHRRHWHVGLLREALRDIGLSKEQIAGLGV